MRPIFPKYFIQESKWADFWLGANNSDHTVHKIELEGFSDQILIYEYPWELGQKFWYLPRLFLPQTKNESQLDLEQYLKDLFLKIRLEANKYQPAFLKIEFDEQLSEALMVANTEDLSKYLNSKFSLNIENKAKTIQYIQTITLDLNQIQNASKITDTTITGLTNFYNETQIFWKTTNENIRRYTKKSLAQNWTVSTEKNQTNFEAFYRIYNQTKDRQNFAIQTESYLKDLFNEDFSRLIVLYDEQNQTQAFWFGIISEQTLTYLYGGNTQISFDKKGQYLLHLVAVKIALDEGLVYYDLGGYNPNLGFGKFKEGYHGIIREFIGPVDIIFKPFKYRITNFLIKLGKLVLGRSK